MSIAIPHNFAPRTYQLDLLRAMDSGISRAITVWHRRAGKDKTLFNLLIKKAFERVGVYYYFFPEFAQGRRVIWDGIDGHGFAFRDHIPGELVKQAHVTDMKIQLVNGSIIQIIGTDKYDKVRGSNPVGCVFSEFAYQNPAAWDVVRPILGENNGWAVFNSTPFGKNHFYELYEKAKLNPKWYTALVTVEDSLDEFGNRYVSEDVINEDRLSGMSEEMIQQEYYCSFTANSQGFYYLEYLNKAEEENRIGRLPVYPDVPVDTWWDIGVGDSTAIWFTQTIGKEIHIIDFYQSNSQGLEHYAKELQSKGYLYNSHNFPHDIGNTEFGTGRTRMEMAENLFRGIKLNTIPKIGLEDGINAARVILPRCYFDADRTEKGLKALWNYHREWDDRTQTYKEKPKHDWSSHAADAFRYLAIGFVTPKQRSYKDDLIRKRRTGRAWLAA